MIPLEINTGRSKYEFVMDIFKSTKNIKLYLIQKLRKLNKYTVLTILIILCIKSMVLVVSMFEDEERILKRRNKNSVTRSLRRVSLQTIVHSNIQKINTERRICRNVEDKYRL